MANIMGLMEKVKIPESIPRLPKQQSENGGNLKTVRKSLEEKMNEKVKIYGFIGMEVYDLSKENRIEIAEIKTYLDKMDVLNGEIEELEKQKEELERKNVKKNICVCGYKLKPQDRFCPNCGEVIERDTVICTCGAELEKTAKFCGVCGKSVEDIINSQQTAHAPAVKECICGAKVPVGQFMCMECGRKIED
ncbi:MAG: zinc ribbon domain-containing protein [Lachnospiraceae bacterium]|nr:zinc ribbon domain-containing protein [Lachnospiraceae bacterium]